MNFQKEAWTTTLPPNLFHELPWNQDLWEFIIFVLLDPKQLQVMPHFWIKNKRSLDKIT